MNFKDDPSDYFYKRKDLNSDRQKRGVYKDLSNTSCFTSVLIGSDVCKFVGYSPIEWCEPPKVNWLIYKLLNSVLSLIPIGYADILLLKLLIKMFSIKVWKFFDSGSNEITFISFISAAYKL